jgi:hypothetical protein
MARFVVGQSEYAPSIPTINFAGNISYDASGVPTSISPVGQSGYSLGSIQWDFGQRSGAAAPFLIAFQAWAQNNNINPWQYQSQNDVVSALSSKGSSLSNNPSSGLNQNTIALLNQFLSDPAGSGWVNTNLTNTSIGLSDATAINAAFGVDQQTLSNVGLQVQNSITGASLNVEDLGLVESWAMKIENQGGDTAANQLLAFLNAPNPYTVGNVQNFISNNYNSLIIQGVAQVTSAYNAYQLISSEAADENPNPIFAQLYATAANSALIDPAVMTSDSAIPSFFRGPKCNS